MPSNKPGSRLIKAAGGVAWRPGPDNEPEILLVHRKKYDDWSLPKGKTEPGEALPAAAVREVLEEGGARLALGRRLASVRYSVGGRPKRVHYWAARVLSVDTRAVPNSEVDEVTWLPVAQAVGKVSYAHDHGVLAEFAARPADTVPLILLRHAKAVDKQGWKRDDAARPLTDAGRADAKSLADLLACFAPRPRLISSSAARCLETLRPFSQLTGEPVREAPAIYIHNKAAATGAADSDGALVTLVREVIAAREPAVLCAHRENIPALRAAALAVLASPGAGGRRAGLDELPKDWDDSLPTAGFWVLNIARTAAGSPASGSAASGSAASGPAAAGPAASGPGERPAAPAEPGSDDRPGRADSGGTAGGAGGAGPAGGADRGDAVSRAPGRRWWQRIRGRPSASVVAPPAAPRVESGDRGPALVPVPVPVPVGLAGADRPVGVLISADRYDLSES